MIASIQLNLRRSGCQKIMLMFCNGKVSPGFESNWELVAIFDNSNPKKSTSKHQQSEDNMPGRMVQNTN